MESKILIDIGYSTREPQILIQAKDSDDPRDKLVSMFTGGSMPGVRDGYCRIERTHNDKGVDHVVIVPLGPGKVLKHIPMMVEYALENKAIDTAEFRPLAAKMLKEGLDLLEVAKKAPILDVDDWINACDEINQFIMERQLDTSIMAEWQLLRNKIEYAVSERAANLS